MENKIKGSLYGAALGDALGATTELRSISQIKNDFDGLVYDFKKIPNDVFARGKKMGSITDDFSLTYYLMKEIIDNEFVFNEKVAINHLLKWSKDEIYYDDFVGPTTRLAIQNLQNNLPTDVDPLGLINYNAKATNGVAMKLSPVALMAETMTDAINNAIKLSIPTHYNSTAMSGASAIAAAIFEAKEKGASVQSIIDSAKYGANKGKIFGINNEHISVAPDMSYKIDQAVKIGENSNDFEELIYNIENKVGTNIQIIESVPAVFAIIAYTKGDPMESIYAGVNCGGDTDTIASMAGAIAGAYKGCKHYPEEIIKKMLKANPTLNIEEKINKFAQKAVQKLNNLNF